VCTDGGDRGGCLSGGGTGFMPGAGAGRENNDPAVGVGREAVELEMDVFEEATELEEEVVGDIGCGTTSG